MKPQIGMKFRFTHMPLRPENVYTITELIDNYVYYSGVFDTQGSMPIDNFEDTLAKNYIIITEEPMKEKDTLTVDREFILEAYKAACNEWKRKLEDKFPDLLRVYYEVGQKFRHKSTGQVYILALVGNKEIMLINTSTGGRFKDKVQVSNTDQIDPYAWRLITSTHDFELIN